MSISQFTEPDINLFFDNLDQAARLNNKASFYGRGYINVTLSNINDSGVPVLLQGGMFECGNVLNVVDTDTYIPLTPSSGQNYIYFNPATRELSYSTATPTWNTIKGGWYNGNNRAIAKLFYTSSQYNGKVILDSYNAMRVINKEQAVPTTGGSQLSLSTYPLQVRSILLPAGAYRFDMQAGRGGRGGNAEVGSGGLGAAGESKPEVFFLYSPRRVFYALGGDGVAGADVSSAVGGGGGGGSTGGSSFIDTGDDFFICIGGSGGGGSAGRVSNSGGGGGGGGHGLGGRGAGGQGGYGGHDGIGGDAAEGSCSGSGIYGGGSASTGYNGGGYGEKGGPTLAPGDTRIGGPSQKGEGAAGPVEKYDRQVQYQGGGAGGAAAQGGAGGGGVSTSSSGYLSIYRMW
jgi:hypothetical protein